MIFMGFSQIFSTFSWIFMVQLTPKVHPRGSPLEALAKALVDAFANAPAACGAALQALSAAAPWAMVPWIPMEKRIRKYLRYPLVMIDILILCFFLMGFYGIQHGGFCWDLMGSNGNI